MTYRPQVKSPRSGRGHQKTQHDKAKARRDKHFSGRRDADEEDTTPSKDQAVEKTLNSLRGLGSQKFALSPFSQYYDDWLINLRKILSVFESNPSVNADDKFIDERSRILAGIESELVQQRLGDAKLDEKLKILSEKNHLLAKTDADYAAETRELKRKRNAEIENLAKTVSDLEKQLDEVNKIKTSLFGVFSKKAKARKQAEAAAKVTSANKELEMAIQNFAVEQEKLHDDYEKRKQAIIGEVQLLERETEEQDTDNSLQYRQVACESLIEAVNSLLERKTQTN